jgi:hypothetical protein
MTIFLVALLVVLAFVWLITRTRRPANRSGDGGGDGSFNSADYNGSNDSACSSSDGGSCGDGGGGGD